ncbi:22674_t:CDS:2 [Gigaspora margarita]|uniref:22674_t:CDS:1 n=1 Tax=Gigaspora margarita TaxID=4874 RepID=A0ABN7V2H6_GIGMA|nr:22674_t:CDS:2 [Gigaspora margarita]
MFSKTHPVLECPKVKYLDKRCTRLARLLTPEQFVELQEVIDERFCNPLNDEQIPAALDFILKVTKDIITREKGVNDLMQEKEYSSEDKGCNEWSGIDYGNGAKAKKVKRRVYTRYQKPVKLDHAEETDDICDADFHNENNSRSGRDGKRRNRSLKTRRKSRRKELSTDLYKSEKEVKNKEYNPEELLQEFLVICSALSQKITRGKEEIMGASATLEPKNLFVNPIKNFPEEILAEIEDKDSIFESYQTDEMDGFEDLEKDRSTEEKGEMIESKDLVKTDDASCRVIDEFNPRKEEKVETLPIEPKEIVNDEALEFLLEIIKEYSRLIAHQDCSSEAQEEETMDLDVDLTEPAITEALVDVKDDNSDDSDETIVKEKDKKETCLDRSENNEFDDGKTWTSEPKKEKIETILTETEEIVDDKAQEENNRRALTEEEEKSIEGWRNVEADEHKTIDHHLGSTGKAPKILEWPLKSAESCAGRIGTKDVRKKEDKRVKLGMEPLMTYLKLAKALADQDESLKVEVKDAEALVLQKFRWKVLASENQRVTYLENEQDKAYRRWKHLYEESVDIGSDDVILVSKMVHDKVSSYLHESYREAFRNIKWDENGEVVTSEVGDIRKCMKAIYTKIVKLLFDRGGRGSVSNNIQKKKMFMCGWIK